MLAFKNWLVSTIKNDTTLRNYLTDPNGNVSIYPVDIDVQPEFFPSITYQDVGVTIRSNPPGMHIGVIQLNIWSTTNAMEVENIYERLGQVFNLKDSTSASQSITGTLWWIRENGARDLHTPSRRIWHKVMDLKFWANKVDNS